MTQFAMSFCAAALAALGAALLPSHAHATLIAPQEVECGTGEYVVGLTGRVGLWSDAVGPHCAGWDTRTYQAVPGRPRPAIGGTGGGQNEQTCPPGSAISGWQVESVIQGDSAFAD